MSHLPVRELRPLSQRDQAEALDRVKGCWAAWAAECLPASETWLPHFEVHAVSGPGSAVAPLAEAWESHGPVGGTAVQGWSSWSERGRQHLAARLLQRPPAITLLPAHDWALQVADLAWAKLTELLLGPRMPATQAQALEPVPDTRPWSGVVFVSEPSLEARWAWRVPASAPSATPSPATSPATPHTILDSVRQRRLALQAELGEVDISLADLMALQAGDVVRFPSGPSQGVGFKLGQASGVAGRAQLGLVNGQLALRLTPSSSVRS